MLAQHFSHIIFHINCLINCTQLLNYQQYFLDTSYSHIYMCYDCSYNSFLQASLNLPTNNPQTTNLPTNQPPTTYSQTHQSLVHQLTKLLIIFERLHNRKIFILQKTYYYVSFYYLLIIYCKSIQVNLMSLLVSIKHIQRGQFMFVF